MWLPCVTSSVFGHEPKLKIVNYLDEIREGGGMYLVSVIVISGSVGGKTAKTGKTSVLPGFSKIECGGGSDGTPHCYGGLT